MATDKRPLLDGYVLWSFLVLFVYCHSRRESLDIVLYLVDSAGVKQVVQTCNATERDLRV